MVDKVKTIGSRAQVMHGTAKKTSGGLEKKDLKYNKQGRIVSRRKSELGHKLYSKHKSTLKKNQYKKKPKTSRKKPKTSRKKPKTSRKKPKTSRKKNTKK
jgi:hypothetical protein